MEVLLPLSADTRVLYRLDYTGGFKVHAWQRRCSWGHIRHISSYGESKEGFGTRLSQ